MDEINRGFSEKIIVTNRLELPLRSIYVTTKTLPTQHKELR